MKKKFLALLLAAIMVVSLVPTTVFAGGLGYTITNGTPETAKEKNHGYIDIDRTTADKDAPVTVTVTPNEGYQLKALTVTPTGFIDLGIKDAEGKPLYWKETNLGASNPQDPGDYYMWGATALMYSAVDRSKTDGAFTFVTENPYGDNYKNTWDASLGFNKNNIPFADGVFEDSVGKRNVFTKYTTIDTYAKSGNPDNLTTLQPEDDAATAKNANWHTPTYDELVALSKNCVLVWTSDYNSTGNAGYIVYKAKNDADKGKANMNGTWKMWDAANSKYDKNEGSEPTGYNMSDIHIFLPAAGIGSENKLNNLNIGGCYWSGTLDSKNDTAYALVLMKLGISLSQGQRQYGYSIRPVMSFSGIPPAKQDDGTYQFTMPAYDVTVTAEFELTAPQVPTVAKENVKAIMCDTYKNNLGWLPQDCDNCNWSKKTISGVNFQYANTMSWDSFASDWTGAGVADYANLHFDIWFAEDGNAPIVKLVFTSSNPTGEITIPGTFKAGWNSVNIDVKDVFDEQPMNTLRILTVSVAKQGGPVAWANILFYNGEYTSTDAPAHTHNPVKVTGQAATETAAGWSDYYECKDSTDACHKYFEDATAKVDITDLNAWKAQGGKGYIAPLVHSITPVNGKNATDTEAGYKPYYECKNCGKYYEDATGLIEITDIDAWKSQTGKGYIPSGNEINAAKTEAKAALDSENAKDPLTDASSVTTGKENISKATTLDKVASAKDAAITAIQAAQAAELASTRTDAKAALDAENAKDPLTDKAPVTTGKANIDAAATKAAVESAKNAAIKAIQDAQANKPDPTPNPTPNPTAAPAPTQVPEDENKSGVTEEYKASVGSDEDSVQVSANITNGVAAIEEIDEALLKEMFAKDASATEDEQAAADESCAITINLSGSKQSVEGVELTKETVENLADIVGDDKYSAESVVVEMGEATVELDAKALEAIRDTMTGDTIRLAVERNTEKNLNGNQKKTLGKYDVTGTFDAYLESNGVRIHDFKGGNVTVSIEFTPEKGKKTKNYKVYYIADNGKLQKHATKYEDGKLTFVTGHFSDYVIIYDTVQDVLLTEAATTRKGYIKLSWNEIDGAVKYVVYGAKCGKSYKELAETDGTSFTIRKISAAKPVSGKTYKVYVVAYDALGNKIKSKAIHYMAGDVSGKYANVKAITPLVKTLELTVGEKVTVGAEYTMYEGKKHVPKSHGKALRFVSDCPEVAKVAKNGTVTAKSEGTAVIYIQDISGKWCQVEVTVK